MLAQVEESAGDARAPEVLTPAFNSPTYRRSVGAVEKSLNPANAAPSTDKTSWDFTKVDSMMVPFLESTKDRAPIISFSTIPAWMFKPPRPGHAADPNKIDWAYGIQGKELIDASATHLGQYHARLMRWYTQGGFSEVPSLRAS